MTTSDLPDGAELWTEFLHDVRTPLASALIGLSLVADGADGADASALTPVTLALEHMRAVLTRAESALAPVSESCPASEHTNVAPLVARAVTQLQPLFDASGVTVVIDSVDDAYARGVDPVSLTRVLVNVLANACRYAPRGTAVHVALVVTGPLVHVVVRDAGPGFDDAHQLPTSGWGIGLRVSSTLMAQMGGALRIGGSSEGALVEILLPA